MPAPDLPPLRDVIREFGLDARRRLGQHFLLDQNLTARIARSAGDLTRTTVIEVGPGPGGLTRSLLAAGAARVVAIEKDERCVAALSGLAAAYPDRLSVIAGDALEQDFAGLAPPPRCVVANLPYNIATPLLLGWLKTADAFTGLTLMFQKEVADRMVAHPGTAEYGRLSVVVQWLCTAELLFHVDARAFVPPPQVASAVVGLTPRAQPLAAADWTALTQVTAAAFGQRRKMLRGALRSLDLAPEAAGIDGRRRGETLTVAEFCALARAHAARAGTAT
ncbi:MAG: 16S rRNA (adenine(1518)-N(6)/adenine(1519)-N(6))-dimethyltransferase RsmA [Rhodospirillales bacterium]|nr:16S rRNA (adenine(1518)-N(6)/adenine(1519)-N(6))-dimethyltransferase RsmA [Rhodospirillales bacterium]